MIAAFIVIFGTTEVAITYELLAMIDLFGVETFVLIYVSGFLVLISAPVAYIRKLYCETAAVLPLCLIKEDPRSLLFLIPNGAKVYVIWAIMVPAFCLLRPDLPVWEYIFRA